AAADYDEEFEDIGASGSGASAPSARSGGDRYSTGVGHSADLRVGEVDPETGLEVVEASGEDAWSLTGR
ncbi:MAG: hypothetical protein L0G36_12780, partial [Brevibacterium sp.]|nr:hypothetical protein [Brevibacterium sp.]